MLNVEFDDTAIKRILEAYLELPDLALNLAAISLEDALIWLKDQLPDDPATPIPEDAPSPIHTEAQRRWWWANLKANNIPGWFYIADDDIRRYETPKKGQLRDAFKVQVTQTPYEVYGTLGTDIPWMPWVVGPDYPGHLFEGKQMYQARIHAYQHRWWRLEEVIEANSEDFYAWINYSFQVMIREELEEMIRANEPIPYIKGITTRKKPRRLTKRYPKPPQGV